MLKAAALNTYTFVLSDALTLVKRFNMTRSALQMKYQYMYIKMEFPVLSGSAMANGPDKKICTACRANKSQGLTVNFREGKLSFNHLFLDVESL